MTHMANSVITDSAAAATALATGHKTTGRFVAVGPRTDDLLSGWVPTAAPFEPLATVLEGARLAGKSTGLVATSRITHATPAAFASHVSDRGMENDIMEQMVYQNVDVVFGGGAVHLFPKNVSYDTTFGKRWKGERTDGENLLDVLLSRGYRFVDNRKDMIRLSTGRAWGLFAESHMDPDIDRDDLHPTQPSLAEMTEKALELLSRNDNGFFLVVEGSQVDWAGHANDPIYMVTEMLAFDQAVGIVLGFAERDGRTLVLICPDHDTGALSIGHEQSGFPPKYTATSVEDLIAPIRGADRTIQALLSGIESGTDAQGLRAAFSEHLGSWWAENLDADHVQFVVDVLRDKGPRNGYWEIASYLSRNLTVLGWTTHGHTGGDVPLWAYGPRRPVGTFDNTDLAGIAAKALGIDLAAVGRSLFVDAAALPGAVVDETDPENPVLRIGPNRLPSGKNLLYREGKEIRLSGIVVHAPKIRKFFVPEDVLSHLP
jgi:alkaline phosphatase